MFTSLYVMRNFKKLKFYGLNQIKIIILTSLMIFTEQKKIYKSKIILQYFSVYLSPVWYYSKLLKNAKFIVALQDNSGWNSGMSGGV